MLHLLDESLESFLRQVVPLPAREVDVAFDAPDADWAAGLSRPTVNLYLWDVRLNTGERDLGMEEVTDSNGRKQRRSPRPRVDCRFLVTAWTTEVRDEHALLGRVLIALLNHTEIEAQYLEAALATLTPLPAIELRAGSASENPDFWSALGGQLKPALDAVITLTVDAALMREVGPPIDEIRLRRRGPAEGIDEESTLATRRSPNA